MSPMAHRAIILVLVIFAYTEAAFDCKGKSDGHYPDPDDCHRFYQCWNGNTYSFACNPSTLVFNPNINTCDWPNNYECNIGSQPTTQAPKPTTQAPKPTTQAPQPTTQAPATTAPQPSQGPTEITCEGRSEGDMFRDPRDCASYYWCVHGQPIRMTCPGGLVFNENKQTCDWPRNVDCSTVTPNPTEEPRTEKPTNAPTFAPTQSPTDMPTEAPTNATTEAPTNAPTAAPTNPTESVTTPPTEAPSEEPTNAPTQAPTGAPQPTKDPDGPCALHEITCDGKPDGTRFSDPEDCSAYYWCVHGKPNRRFCSPPLLFSEVTETCDWSNNVNCKDDGKRVEIITPAPAPVTKMPAPVTEMPQTAQQPQLTTQRPEETKINTSPSTGEISCSGRQEGDMFRDPTSCASYYWCVHGVPQHKTCATGLVFNAVSKNCDWPRNVDCDDDGDVPATPGPTQTPQSTPKPQTTQRPQTTQGPQPTQAPETTQKPNPTEAPETTQGPQPTQAPPSGGCARRVCYYTNWSQYRPGNGKFFPEDIDPFLCSHIVFAFAKLTNNHLAPFEWNDESTDWSKGLYERFNDLKARNPNLKTLLAVGGWNMGSGPFTNMVATQESRQDFADHSVTFLKKWKFDGLDLDWEYPAARGSPAADKAKFAELVKQLRETYNRDATQNGGTPLLLTAAVSAGKETIDNGYDIPAISRDLDFINLMSYDLHGAWDPITGHNSPLYAHPSDTGDRVQLNVDFAAQYWAQKGCPREKLVIGLPTYGRVFRLSSPSNNGVGAPASGAGTAGQFTREGGFLAYYEICTKISTANLVKRDPDMKVPYLVYNNDQWVGYDDIDSLQEKVRYIKKNGFGGVMTWALPLDDFKGTFCNQGRYPLWSAVNAECQK